MTLERRLAKLEGRRGGAAFMERDAEAFTVMIDKLVESVRRQGDFQHRAEASPAANLARALLRGDDAMAEAILAKATALITPRFSDHQHQGEYPRTSRRQDCPPRRDPCPAP